MDYAPLTDIWHCITFSVGAALVGWLWWTNFRSFWIGLGALAVCSGWGALLIGTEFVLDTEHKTLEQLLYAAAAHGRFWIAVGIGGIGALCLLASVGEQLFGNPPKKPEPDLS